jgi:hypothetical protein
VFLTFEGLDHEKLDDPRSLRRFGDVHANDELGASLADQTADQIGRGLSARRLG